MAAPPSLLDEIRARGGSLRHTSNAAAAPAAGRDDAPTATMLRGGLLHEIQKGKDLKPVPRTDVQARPNATLMRGNMFQELKSKRPAVPAATTSQGMRNISTVDAPRLFSRRTGDRASSARTSTASQAAPSSQAASQVLSSGGVIKHGVVHKRASNGIWQRRYFILTTDALHYASREPRKGHSVEEMLASPAERGTHSLTHLPMAEIHDVHPLGHGAEFCVLHNERRMRLRATSMAEAANWVSSLISAGLDHKRQAGSGGDDSIARAQSAGTVVRGLIAPNLQVSGVDEQTGEPWTVESLPDCLVEMSRQLETPASVCAAIRRGAAHAVDGGSIELEAPLPALIREWLTNARPSQAASPLPDLSTGRGEDSSGGLGGAAAPSPRSAGPKTVADAMAAAEAAAQANLEKAMARAESEIEIEIAAGAGAGPSSSIEALTTQALATEDGDSVVSSAAAEAALSGPLGQLLRWMHPRVLHPAFHALRTVLDGSKLSGLDQLDYESWNASIDFDHTAAAAVHTSSAASGLPTMPSSSAAARPIVGAVSSSAAAGRAAGRVITIRHSVWHSCSLSAMNAAAEGAVVGSSDDGRGGPTLRFQTELCLTFAPGSLCDVSSCDLKIVDVDFEGQPFARGVKDEAKAALRTLCLPHLEYSLIWRRPLHRLPVHKDVPRLLKGLLVVGADGSEMYREDGSARPAEPHTVIAALRSLMLTLARHLDALSVVALIEEKLDVFLPPDTGDVAGGLRHFLLESGIPEHSLFVLIFKAVHQEMIFPAVFSLRTSIYGQLPYKDMKGEWKVRIDLRPNEIRISHLKWEQTHEPQPEMFAKFCWCLELTFDRRMRSLQGAKLHVVDYGFGDATSAERVALVERVLRPWLAPGTLYKRMWLSLGEEAPADAHSPPPTSLRSTNRERGSPV